MNGVYRSSADPYFWFIYGTASINFPWNEFFSGDGFASSQWLTIRHVNNVKPGFLPLINLSSQVADAGGDHRNEDRVTFDLAGSYQMILSDVEYVDSTLTSDTHLRHYGHFGFSTDGSVRSIVADVGNHHMDFTTAIKDNSLNLGNGWDIVTLGDHLDIPGTQYWSLIRRGNNELDAYSLLTGHRIRMEGGAESLNGVLGNRNFGEVEQLVLADYRAGGTVTYRPGVDLTTGRGTFANIDLRTVEMVSSGSGYVATDQKFSDSFNLAYFNFIRYTSDNVWVGEATIHNGTIYSTPSDRTVDADKSIYLNSGYIHDAPVLSGQLSVIGQSRNGTHDLIVAEQATAIDGKLRVYTFNVQSGLYNEFNRVYLGDTVGRDVNMSNMGSTFADRVALYGFGGNDTLTAGSGRDYVFGGLSSYNTVASNGQSIVAASGNIVTGGKNADYFGVGATDDRGRLIDGTKAVLGAAGLPTGAPQGFFTGSASTGGIDGKGTGLFWASYATDVITDWQAGVDTLVVLENGVAIIGGLRESSGDEDPVALTGNNVIDLRATTAIATSDQNFSGARGGADRDLNPSNTALSTTQDWDATKSLNYIFDNQAVRDSKSITNEGDVTVVNNGLIVIRGLAGEDTIYGSPGDDYIYGNRANNVINVSNGGNDRIYYDTFDGSAAKHFVTGFTNSSNTAEADKFFVNKRVIDSFYTDAILKQRDLNPDDVNGVYTQAQAYNSRINFLHDAFYNPGFVAPNETHEDEDGQAPSVLEGSDGTTFGIGAGLVTTGFAMLFIPFVGPGIAKALFATGVTLGAGTMLGSAVSPTDPHLNATYSGDVSSYLNVLTGAGLNKPDTSGNAGLNTSVRFHDFFPGVNANDGYLPVVEFTGTTSNGQLGGPIYGYFAVHSSDHTFVYLVASRDHLVENSEALLVAQINGNLLASDFGIYDGTVDIYNSDAPPEPPVVLVDPDINAVRDSNTNTTPDYGFREPIASHPSDNDSKIVASSTPALAKIVVTGTVAVPSGGTALSAAQLRVYDGTTKIFDGNPATAVAASFSITAPAGVITGITLSNAGQGLADGSYKNVLVVAGSGSGGFVDFTIRGGGVVASSVQLVNGGTGYSTGAAAFVIGNSAGQVSSFANLGGLEVSGTAFTFIDNRALGTIARQSDTEALSQDNNFTLTSSRASYTVERVDPLTSLVTRDSVKVIEISGGSATINGGGGNDTLTITSQADANFLNGATNDQVLSMESLVLTATPGMTLNLSQQQEGFTVTLSQNGDTVTGGQGANIFIGGAGNDSITGGGANDVFNGFTSGDTFVGGLGLDKLQLFGTNTALNSLTIDSSSDNKIREIEIVELIISERQPIFSVTTGTNGTITELRLTDPGAGLADGVYTRNIVGSGGSAGSEASVEFEVVSGSVKTVFGSINSTVSAPLPITTSSTLTSAGGTILNGGTGYSGTGTYTVNTDVALAGLGGNVNLSSQTDGFTILGSQYNDTLTGSSGNDTITGGAGADTLTGGAGNDVYVYTGTADVAAAETITEGVGGGTDRLRVDGTTDFSVMAAANFDEIEELAITGAFTATFLGAQLTGETMSLIGDTGSTQALVVTATAGATTDLSNISAGANWTAGTDTVTINGADGSNEVIVGTQTADVINGGSGDDNIFGGSGDDSLVGGAGNDTIFGGVGADIVEGGDGDDVFGVSGTSEQTAGDVIIGGGGTNEIHLFVAPAAPAPISAEFDFDNISDVLVIRPTGDVTQNRSVTFSAISEDTNQTVVVNGSNLTTGALLITNNAGSATTTFNITGGGGNDLIAGSSGNDTITGGAGVDTLSGGEGNDVFKATVSDVSGLSESINGGNGIDTLEFTNAGSIDLTTVTLSSVEIVQLIGTSSVTLDADSRPTTELRTGSGNTSVGAEDNIALTINALDLVDGRLGQPSSDLTLSGSFGAVIINNFKSDLFLSSSVDITSLSINMADQDTVTSVVDLRTSDASAVVGNVSINISEMSSADTVVIYTDPASIGGYVSTTYNGADGSNAKINLVLDSSLVSGKTSEYTPPSGQFFGGTSLSGTGDKEYDIHSTETVSIKDFGVVFLLAETLDPSSSTESFLDWFSSDGAAQSVKFTDDRTGPMNMYFVISGGSASNVQNGPAGAVYLVNSADDIITENEVRLVASIQGDILTQDNVSFW